MTLQIFRTKSIVADGTTETGLKKCLSALDLTLLGIGAIIGYFCGSAFIGAVAGAILGVVNYKLVSVRWLKMVPK